MCSSGFGLGVGRLRVLIGALWSSVSRADEGPAIHVGRVLAVSDSNTGQTCACPVRRAVYLYFIGRRVVRLFLPSFSFMI